VLVVGLNLALDRTLRMPQLVPGRVQRPRSAEMTAGGKAVNVCRAAQAHLVRPRLVANLPGVLGGFVGDLLDREGHDVRRVRTGGEARSAIIILEDDLRVTVLNEPGPQLAGPDRAALLAAVDAEAGGHRVAVLSGSLPPGPEQRLYAELVGILHARGLTVVLDTARDALAQALPGGPDVVTPNLAEARAVLGLGVDESVEPEGEDVAGDAVAAAQALRRAGARAALVTAGRHGVAGVDADGAFWVSAPGVAEVNPIGAGDAFAAGLGVGLERGEALRAATVRAVATGAASVATPLAGSVDPELLARLLPSLGWQELGVADPAGGAR
jgi:1-phosphofructokinase family hexose kinase